MAKSSSLNQFHKLLNFLILILCVVVFGLMVRLIRNEYFNSSKAIVNSEVENFQGNTEFVYNTPTNLSLNESGELNINSTNLVNLVLPDETELSDMTESSLSDSTLTNAVVDNGEVTVPSTLYVDVNASEFSINSNKLTEMVPIATTSQDDDNTEDPFMKQSMVNKVKNFLKYPDEQKFCPNIDNSESSFWSQLPEKFAGDHYAKFCCTSCFYLISEEIYCGENLTGLYILDNLSIHDIDNLNKVYNELNEGNNKLDFRFPEIKLSSLLGKPVLKYKYNDIYYPIQVIKSTQDLYLHETNPTIMKELYKETYDCPNVATQPVMKVIIN